MAGAVSRLPEPAQGGSDGVPPADLYRIAVEEYRFQATFNWSRTQYMLVFNTGILAAAAAVASQPGRGAALVFALGFVTCLLSALVIRTQQSYYRAARDRMRRVESDLGIPERQRTDTTATLGGRSRAVSVTQLIYLMLGSVAVANVVGAILIALR